MHPSYHSQTLLEYHGMFFLLTICISISSLFSFPLIFCIISCPHPTTPSPVFPLHPPPPLSLPVILSLRSIDSLLGPFPPSFSCQKEMGSSDVPSQTNCVSPANLFGIQSTHPQIGEIKTDGTQRVMIRKDGKREAVPICTPILFSFFLFFLHLLGFWVETKLYCGACLYLSPWIFSALAPFISTTIVLAVFFCGSIFLFHIYIYLYCSNHSQCFIPIISRVIISYCLLVLTEFL